MNEVEDLYHLGVKAVIRNDMGQILLLKVNTEKMTSTSESYWDLPGGRIQRGSTIEETLMREIEEEIGIKEVTNIEYFSMVLSKIRIPLEPADVGLILAIYTCEIDPNARLQLSNEHTEIKWSDPGEASELLAVKYPASFTREVLNLSQG